MNKYYLAASLLAFSALSQVSCDSKQQGADNKKSKAAGEPAESEDKKANSQLSDKGTTTLTNSAKPVRAKFSWAKLQTWDIKEGISPPEVAPTEEVKPTTDSEAKTLSFRRLAAGKNTFCGALQAGPMRCWGRLSSFEKGAFVDIAVSGDALCGVTTSGALRCVGLESQPNLSGAKRIAAGGGDFCLLQEGGEVSCFSSKDEAALKPPADLKAKYLVVGGGFGCAADQANRLQCWGETSALGLPTEPPTIRDLAAGREFVCYLTSSKELKCAGKAPSVPEGKFEAIAAGFEQVCVVTEAKTAACYGGIEESFENVARLAVGATAVCALDQQGTVRCQGTDSDAQLAVPLSRSAGDPASGPPKAISEKAFNEFLELFPKVDLPYALNRNTEFDVGDRVPAQFAQLIDGAANDYRIGVRIPTSSGAVAVTLLHMPTGMLELHTFSPKGMPAKHRTVAGRTTDSGRAVESPNGTSTRTFSAKAVESTVTPDGLLQTTTYEGQEVTHYVKEHIDGSRPVSRIACNITGTKASDTIQKSGQFVRKSAEVLPSQSSTDKKGCRTDWPMQR